MVAPHGVDSDLHLECGLNYAPSVDTISRPL
jgi:hypothetical protein